jgi:sugar phosphate isomerase/epimerase
MQTRRDFGKCVVSGLALSALGANALRASVKTDATVRGVKLGAITGAYGPFPTAAGQDVIDVIIQKSVESGCGYVELVNSTIEPPMGGPCAAGFGGGGRGGSGGRGAGTPGAVAPAGVQAGLGGGRGGSGGRGGGGGRGQGCGVGGQVPAVRPEGYEEERDKLRQWRLTADLNRFREIRRKFDAAGLDLFSYVMTIGDDFTDPEIEAVFRHMQALGVNKFCTNQTRVGMGLRMVPYAEKYKIMPAFHTHDQVSDPNEVATPESLAKLLAMSNLFMVNLDIGWFFRGGNDPFAYMKEHHERITHLHVRDAMADKSQADIGTGVIPVAEMLRYVRDNKFDIAFIVEQGGHAGSRDNADALRMNIDWMKQQLSA